MKFKMIFWIFAFFFLAMPVKGGLLCDFLGVSCPPLDTITITTDKEIYYGVVEQTVLFNISSEDDLDNLNLEISFTERRGADVIQFFEMRYEEVTMIDYEEQCQTLQNGSLFDCERIEIGTHNVMKWIPKPIHINFPYWSEFASKQNGFKRERPELDLEGRKWKNGLDDGMINIKIKEDETQQYMMRFQFNPETTGEFSFEIFDDEGYSRGFLDPYWQGQNVFFYDPTNDSSINTSLWVAGQGSPSETSTQITMNDAERMHSKINGSALADDGATNYSMITKVNNIDSDLDNGIIGFCEINDCSQSAKANLNGALYFLGGAGNGGTRFYYNSATDFIACDLSAISNGDYLRVQYNSGGNTFKVLYTNNATALPNTIWNWTELCSVAQTTQPKMVVSFEGATNPNGLNISDIGFYNESDAYVPPTEFVDYLNFTTPVLETTNQTFYVGILEQASDSVMIYNGVTYNMSILNFNSTYTNFTVGIIVPLAASNGSSINFHFNWTNATGTRRESNTYTQNLQYSYFPTLNTDSISTTPYETESLDVDYNVTSYFALASMSHYAAVYDSTFDAVFVSTINDNVTSYTKATTFPLVPTNPTTVNIAGYINVSYNGTSYLRASNATRDVNQITIFECTDAANATALNISIRDEINRTILLSNNTLEVTFSFSYGIVTQEKNVSLLLQDSTNYSICVSPTGVNLTTDAMMQYSGDSHYSIRNYYLNNYSMSNVTRLLDLFLSNLTITNFNVINFHVIDENANDLSDVYISVQRFYPSNGTYATTELLRTDSKGRSIGHLILYDEIYRFMLVYNGDVVLYTEPNIISQTSIEWQVTTATDVLERLFNMNDITYSLSYTNTTGNVRCIIADTTGTMLQGCLNVTERSAYGDSLVCSTCDTSSSMTLLCGIGINISRTHMASCFANYNNDGTATSWLLDTLYITPNITNIFGMVGVFFGGFLLLGTMMFAGLVYGVSASAVLGLIGIFILQILNVLTWGWSTFIVLCVIGFLFAWRAKS